MRDIHGILYLIRDGSVIFLGKIGSLKRVLCFETGRRVSWNRSLAKFGSINRTWPNGKLTPHVKLMEYKDESMSKDSIQETFSFIWDCQHRKGKFHLEQRNSRHRETAARFSKRNGPGCVCPIWREEFIKFPWFQPFSQTLFFGMLFVSPLMCGCFLQGDMNCVYAAWWVYKNANHQLRKMIRHPAFCH